MNNLYFACCDCKIYIDAGYRWAYWELEDAGVVSRGQEIDVDTVLSAQSYWNPKPEEGSWLTEEVFPPLREFLGDHKSHRIVFGEVEDFAPDDDYAIEWMQIGYMLSVTPRYLVEMLGITSWDQVVEYMGQEGRDVPTWYEVTYWGLPSPHEKGKQKFEQLVSGRMRFVLYGKGKLRSGLRFDFYYDDGTENNQAVISVTEEDVFTIEPVFYKILEDYSNYGHWGQHTIETSRKEEFVSEIKSYIECLIAKTEQQYWPKLNMNNFGGVYRDIENHREEVVAFAQNFLKWVENSSSHSITICGI